MSFPAQKTNAIYGDSNAQTATVVPDLSAAADGINLQVSSNLDELNINQRLDLNDLVYDTNTEEIYASIVAPGQIAITGNTMGWTDVSKMFIELDLGFSYTVQGTFAKSTPVNGVNNNQYRDFMNANKASYPNSMFLQPLIRFVAQMGENNQIVGRQQMNYLQGIKLICQDLKTSREEIYEYMNMGSPRSHQGRTINNTLNAQGTTAWQSQDIRNKSTSLKTDEQNIFNNIIGDIMSYLESVKANAGTTTSTNWSATQRFKLAVPLKYLNSFFRESAFIPPGLKFRFEIEYSLSSFLICMIPAVDDSSAALSLSDPKGNIMVSCNYGTDIRLVYRRHQLRQPEQAKVNTMWLTKPFLYMYQTYEFIEIPCDGVNIHFEKDIAISQQRPTSLIMKVLPVSTNNTGVILRQLGTPYTNTFGTNPTLSVNDFSNSDATYVNVSNLSVYIAGRQNYYLRTRIVNGNRIMPNIMDGTNILNHATNRHIDQELDEESLLSSGMATNEDGMYLQISINPGDMQKNGYISTDQGATVIRLAFDITNATQDPAYQVLSTNYKIVVYKKLQEQLQLDAAKNITTITWPAVKSNSGFLLQNTYNLN